MNKNWFRAVLYGFVITLSSLIPLTAHASISVDLADCPLGAASDTIVHSQTSLGKELLFDCPLDIEPFPHEFITRFYTITNDTGRDWLGYDLEVLLEGESGDVFGWDDQTNPNLDVLADVNFMGTMVWIDFDQPLQPNEIFTGLFRYGQYLSGVASVYGMAKVPEPGTIALFGLGLAGLGFARRKKA